MTTVDLNPTQQIGHHGPVVGGYVVRLTCPRCGRPVSHINARQPGPSGMSAMAIVRCDRRACPEFELRVELITCGAPPSTPRPQNPKPSSTG